MKETKFGLNQFKNPTPTNIVLAVKILSAVLGVVIGWLATSTIIGPHSKDFINQILGLILLLINTVSPFFGVPITGKVDASEVSAIDTKA